jgi:anti-anti-sigma factor
LVVNDGVSWQLQIERRPEHTVLRVLGDLDLETAPRLAAGAQPLLVGGSLVIDLSQLTFIDSSGLSALIRINQRVRAAGHELTIISPVPRVAKAFEVTGLDQVLPLRPGPP